MDSAASRLDDVCNNYFQTFFIFGLSLCQTISRSPILTASSISTPRWHELIETKLLYFWGSFFSFSSRFHQSASDIVCVAILLRGMMQYIPIVFSFECRRAPIAIWCSAAKNLLTLDPASCWLVPAHNSEFCSIACFFISWMPIFLRWPS